MGHPVTVVPCMNRVRYDRALTAKPTTQYHDPELAQFFDNDRGASNDKMELDDYLCMVADDPTMDFSVQSEEEPFHV
jgi:hypothetical protein